VEAFLEMGFIERFVSKVIKKLSEVEIEIKIDPGARMPTRHLHTDAGWDLYVSEDTWARPGETTEVPTGVYINLPTGFEMELKPRSGWGMQGLIVHHGVIDAGYQGEISIFVHNWTPARFEVRSGDRIAQMCIRCVHQVNWKHVDELSESVRGTKGHGSSGR